MILITAADLRFREIAEEWIDHAKKWGYNYSVYDLGNLGFGTKGFEVQDLNFITRGYYNSYHGQWKSTGLHKPAIIGHALNTNADNIGYLDADAFVMKPFILNFNDFDIAVVERQPNPDKNPVKVLVRGDYNAGVIFFTNNERIRSFVAQWKEETQKQGNDQAALSYLLKRSNLRIKVLPFRYNTNSVGQNTIILHTSGAKKYGKTIRQSYH